VRNLKSVGGVLGLLSVMGLACQPPPPTLVTDDNNTDLPLRNAPDLSDRFREGDAEFERIFTPQDGLGPLYIRSSCGGCHQKANKGPGSVEKMAVVKTDGVTPAEDQSVLPYGHTVRPYKSAGATQALLAPPGASDLKLTVRNSPAVFGRGYLEAISDAEVERLAAEQAARSDGIHGRINRVTYHSQHNPGTLFHQHIPGETNLIGRFGLKARIASLDEFAADALQGDMGMTSPLRPTELPNPDGLTDDLVKGMDVTLEQVNLMGDYMRLLEIPKRNLPKGNGAALFAQVQCAVCHVPSLKTRADYPFSPLANVDAPVFTDLLLHDMGTALADGLNDESAGSRDWRTAPLMGLHTFHSFLHDGRAKSVEEAILAHQGPGSEANGSVTLFQQLSAADKATLLSYVNAL